MSYVEAMHTPIIGTTSAKHYTEGEYAVSEVYVNDKLIHTHKSKKLKKQSKEKIMVNFSDIIYKYPEPTINIGDSHRKRKAEIKFSFGLDDKMLAYDEVKIFGVSKTSWIIEDIYFMQEVFKKILEINGKTLDYTLEKG